MATSKPSQPPLFETGESPPASASIPTPTSQMAKHAAATDWEKEHRPRHLHVLVSTSSPGATPASHSHSPGSDWARRMTAISGRRCEGWSTLSDPVSSWQRTLLATSRWASTLFYLTWKRTATPAGRSLYRLVPSTPSTGATGFGSWPTARARDAEAEGYEAGLRRQERYSTNTLPTAVKQNPTAWPTPRAGHEYRQHTVSPSYVNGTHGWNISAAVQDSISEEPNRAWPTPQHHDAHQGQANRVGRYGTKHGGRNLNDDVAAAEGMEKAKLHGRWTLALMGFPPDWCDDLPPDPLSPT
jgi:hypothetical protein